MSALENFKKNLGIPALKVEKETGGAVPARIGMGQAAHESGYGASGLSSPDSKLEIFQDDGGKPKVIRIGPANNYFGFTAEKGTYWRSQNLPYVLMLTHEWVKKTAPGDEIVSTTKDAKTGEAIYKVKRKRPFRSYATPEESYRDWARLVTTSPAYVKAGSPDALRKGDVAAYAQAMKTVGYATDPNYATLITRSINEIGNIA